MLAVTPADLVCWTDLYCMMLLLQLGCRTAGVAHGEREPIVSSGVS
jgi:hypothetical protein